MFLTARILGVFCYIVLLLATLFAVRYFSNRQTKYIFVGYLVVLCIMSVFYVPYITADIYRLSQYAAHYAQMSWNDFLYLLSSEKSGLFTLIYFRLFSNMLMPITCSIVFGVMFYILYTSGKQLQVTRSVFMLVLMWLMTNDFYLIAITNIRSYVAVAFVSFCIYREIFQHKFGVFNLLFYFCAVEMHAMGIVLVVFRVIMYLFSSGKLTIWKIIFIPLIIIGVIMGFSSYQDLLIGSTNKFENYYTSNDYNYVWERIIFIIQTIVQLYILWKSYVYRIWKSSFFVAYKTIATSAVIILVICHLHVTFMQRWIIFSAFLEIPVLLHLLQEEQTKRRHQIKQFLIATCLLTFSIVCTRGNLCSLKFWE